jgi:hypothetical protein
MACSSAPRAARAGRRACVRFRRVEKAVSLNDDEQIDFSSRSPSLSLVASSCGDGGHLELLAVLLALFFSLLSLRKTGKKLGVPRIRVRESLTATLLATRGEGGMETLASRFFHLLARGFPLGRHAPPRSSLLRSRHKPPLSLSHLCRLLTASGCTLSVASGEEGACAAAATARTAREWEEAEDGAAEGTEGSTGVGGAVCGRFLGGLSPRCDGPEGLARARTPPDEEGLARSMVG